MRRTIRRNSVIALALLCLLLAVLLIAEPGRLLKLDKALAVHGFQTGFKLDHHLLATLPSDKPYLVTAVFAECPDVCPMNMNTLAHLAERFKDDLGFVLISLDVGADKTGVQAWAELALPGAMVIHADVDAQLRQIMRQLPESFYPAKGTIHHSGAIYLMYPNRPGLIKYRAQDRQYIYDDILTLKLNRQQHASS
ncbi:hypothetical protein MPL1_08434 [Methylophaga lonarensis MPL]|uniref:SCO family protein n=1 Tax=Methylophaga lonarensis MPL TaxID=1286106 RepID=M7NVJ7_9GAMM|nr:SCO family protein [Methylophaga lonarensis]EMR12758.1 hypothetical protein MPL1_08434 [Methylophaga lonarensis MPL]